MSGRARIVVDLAAQVLALYRDGRLVRRWPVSTARNGPGAGT
jgi:hypothetical protein